MISDRLIMQYRCDEQTAVSFKPRKAFIDIHFLETRKAGRRRIRSLVYKDVLNDQKERKISRETPPFQRPRCLRLPETLKKPGNFSSFLTQKIPSMAF